MQEDFEPILERQIHHLINYIQGIMHIGQRDIAWIRVSKAAVEKGFTLKDIGVVLHAKFHQDFGKPSWTRSGDPVHQAEDVDKIDQKPGPSTRQGRACGEDDRRGRGDLLLLHPVPVFAPTHVCTVSPERTGLCGAYNWMDCKASYEINPTGPNQPIEKGECLDPVWAVQGVNEFVKKASRGPSPYNFYSMVNDPMTTCGCCECHRGHAAGLQRRHDGQPRLHRRDPLRHEVHHPGRCHGRRRSLAGFCGPFQVQHHPAKFIAGDGGLLRMVWMPKILKEEIKERLDKRGEELGVPDLYDMIADETVGITEEEILPFLQEKGHPALSMDPIRFWLGNDEQDARPHDPEAASHCASDSGWIALNNIRRQKWH
jgi:acetyl-CoA synthase